MDTTDMDFEFRASVAALLGHLRIRLDAHTPVDSIAHRIAQTVLENALLEARLEGANEALDRLAQPISGPDLKGPS